MGIGHLWRNTYEKADGQGREKRIPTSTDQCTRILVTIKINDDKVVQLKYVPEIEKEVKDKEGDGEVTKKIKIEAKWKAKLESGQEAIVNEEFISKNFGEKFTDECK